MKKYLIQFLLAAALPTGFASCSEHIDAPALPEPAEALAINSRLISEDEAVTKAQSAYQMLIGAMPEVVSRSGGCSVHTVCRPGSRALAADTLAYLVNFPDSAGYALIAASRNAEDDMLALVPSGHLESLEDIKVEPQKAYLKMLLSNLKDREAEPQSRAGDISLRPMPEEKYVNDTTRSVSGKQSGLEWGQGEPLGQYCNNGISGCFPLATALMMAYFEEPKNLNVSFDYKDMHVAKIVYPDWTDIKKFKDAKNVSYGWWYPTDKSCDDIGLITRQIGQVAGTKYLANGNSSTPHSNEEKALKQLFPNRTIGGEKNYDMNAIASALNKAPVMMWGYLDGKSDQGHVWLAEEYKYMEIKSDYYTREYMHLYWTYVSTSYRTYYDLYFNWGWDGHGNGYYSAKYAEKFTPTGVNLGAFSKLKYMTIQ